MSKKLQGWLALAVLAVGMSVQVSAEAADRVVKIVNRTNVVLTEFYASNVKSDDWEEDILDDEVLMPGESININIDDGTGACRFDFKGVFKDGDEVVKKNVDVCRIGTFEFKP